MEQDKTGIARAVEVAGSQGLLAAVLGVTQQMVSTWVRQGWVPKDRALEIEGLYGIPRRELVSPSLRDLLEPPSFGSVGE